MTDTFSKTARPPTAAIAWTDARWLYVEYPVKGNAPPYVTRYAKTLDNLAAAFNILREAPAETTTIVRDHPAVRRVAPTISDETRATAADIVRRMLK